LIPIRRLIRLKLSSHSLCKQAKLKFCLCIRKPK